jgi:hypothetical protein
VNELLTYAIMLDSVIVAYIQFMMMLTELKKVLSQELIFLFVQQDYYIPIGMNCTKNCESLALTFLFH